MAITSACELGRCEALTGLGSSIASKLLLSGRAGKSSRLGQGARRGDVGDGQQILEILSPVSIISPGGMKRQEREQARGNQKGLLWLLSDWRAP